MSVVAAPARPGPIKYPASTRPLQVVRRELVAPDVVALTLAQPGTGQFPGSYQPGQFITLAIPGEEGFIHRSYSLCGSGQAEELWQIAVKRMEGGTVSNYVIDQVCVGDVLHATGPHGQFVLPPVLRADQQFVFVAAGSGMTPLRGMLRAIALLPTNRQPRVQLHYASSTPEAVIFREELAALDPGQRWLRQFHYISAADQHLSPTTVFANARPLPRATEWYVCGPEGLNQDMRQALTAVDVGTSRIHTEIFTDQSQRRTGVATGPVVAHVAVQDTAATLDVRERETLLEALERQGYQPEFSCRAGSCGTCQVHLLKGRVRHPGAGGLTPDERQANMILSCVAQPLGEVVIESGGRPPRGLKVHLTPAAIEKRATKQSLRIVAGFGTVVMLIGLWFMTSVKPTNQHATLASPSQNSNGDGNQINNGGTNSGTNTLPIPSGRTGSS